MYRMYGLKPVKKVGFVVSGRNDIVFTHYGIGFETTYMEFFIDTPTRVSMLITDKIIIEKSDYGSYYLYYLDAVYVKSSDAFIIPLSSQRMIILIPEGGEAIVKVKEAVGYSIVKLKDGKYYRLNSLEDYDTEDYSEDYVFDTYTGT